MYSLDNWSFIISDIHGRKNHLLSKIDYNSLVKSKNFKELIIKLNHYFPFINENMKFTIKELRNKLYENIIFELNEFNDFNLEIISYFLDYNRIMAFFTILEIGDSVYYTGTIDEFRGLSSCRSFSEAVKLYINNSKLEIFFKNIKYKKEFKDNNLQELLCKTLKNYFDFYFYKSNNYFKNIIEIEGDRQIIEICLNGKLLKDKLMYFPEGSKISAKKKKELININNIEEIQDSLNFKKDPVTEIINTQLKVYTESFKEHDDLACIYGYFRLKEQEMQNILWIAECIMQNNRNFINEYATYEEI